ncbi:MAG: hypothetical protein EAZ27_11965 [Cytophagales bacterium]|nr:MAG: hypothetical protein EAZ27_11965 [Cytophagales bacterium]
MLYFPNKIWLIKNKDMIECFKGENEIEFKHKFATTDAYLSYLSAYRWKNIPWQVSSPDTN